MHEWQLNGVLMYVLRYGFYATGIAAVAVTVDALRRPASHFVGWDRRWVHLAPQALYAVALVVGMIAGRRVPIGGYLFLLSPLLVALQVAYLLRVVFPSPKRLAKRTAAEGRGQQTEPIEPASADTGE